MLNWISRFNIFCFLHDQCIAGAGLIREVLLHEQRTEPEDEQDWIFLHLGYGLKAETMGVKGGPPDPIGFPDAFLFMPQYVLLLEEDRLSIGSCANDHEQVFQEIVRSTQVAVRKEQASDIALKSRLTKEEYLAVIKRLKQHILRGDCYEINFCQEFYGEDVVADALEIYQRLTQVSPNPFAAFYRHHDQYLMCASPERFIKKNGKRIISQPMKGTIGRGKEGEDEALKRALYESQKERSENVMVVDLVRNDLSMICREGTVKVDELFGIYPFPQVHQMISTVSGELRGGVGFWDIVKACFPMGSMTGAPKKRVLELIDQYETTGRGLFSGSIGYIRPGGDFDLNVVIRSIFYNEGKRYLNYMVGSGITHYCEPEKEYDECLLKSRAMQQSLNPKP